MGYNVRWKTDWGGKNCDRGMAPSEVAQVAVTSSSHTREEERTFVATGCCKETAPSEVQHETVLSSEQARGEE